MILEEVMYQAMFCMNQGTRLTCSAYFFKIVVEYTKRNKESIGGYKCVTFQYDQP